MKESRKTLRSVMELVPRGGRLVISLPSPGHAVPLLRAAVRAAGTGRPAILAAPDPIRTPDGQAPLHIPLADLRSPQDAVAAIRKAAGTQRRPGWLIIDLSGPAARWSRTSPQRTTFFEALGRLGRKASLHIILIISHQSMPAGEIARLKDDADVFLQLTRIRRVWRGQILNARARYAPGLFEPAVFALDERPSGGRTDSETSAGTFPGYEAVFDRADQALAVIDLRGSFRRFNAKAAGLLGYTPGELDHLGFGEIVTSASARRALRALATLRRRGRAEAEIEIRRRNGKPLFVSVTGSAVADGLFLVGMRDITAERADRRSLEAIVRNQSERLDRLPFPSAIFQNKRLQACNPAFRAAFQGPDVSSPREITLTHIFGRRNAALLQTPAAEGGHGRRLELSVPRPNGGEEWYEVTAVDVEQNGKSALYCLFVPAGERREALEQLRTSADHYRTLVEQSPDAMAVLREGKVAFSNSRLASMMGYGSPAELTGADVSPLWPEAAVTMEGGRGRGGKPAPALLETGATRKDGSKLVLEAHLAQFPLAGAPATLVCFRDITTRKREEAATALRWKGTEFALEMERTLEGTGEPGPLLEAALHAVMRNAGAEIGAAFLVDEQARLLRLACEREVPGKVLAAFSGQSTEEGIPGFVLKTREPLVLSLADYPPHLPYRSRFAAEGISLVLFLPLSADGAVHGLLMAARRKPGGMSPPFQAALTLLSQRLGALLARAKAFTALRTAEERYRSAVESIADVIYQLTPDGAPLFISPNVERLLGHAPGELFRNPDLWRTILHPDDRPILSQRILNRTGSADAFHIEYRILPKGKASYRWIRDSIRYRRGDDGAVLSITGILSDISDRMELEAALIKSEEMKSNVLESVQEGVMVLDRELRCIDWNRAMETMTGVSRGEVIGRAVTDLLPPLAGEPAQSLLERALLGESLSTDDLPLPDGDGPAARFVWMRFSPLRDSAGAIRGVVGIVTDISARRRLEREVRESEETLRNVIDAMGDALMISDLKGKVWEVNREFSRVTGYPRSEVLGLDFPYPWVMEEEMARFVTWIAELRERTYLRDFDMTWRKKDGQVLAISLNTTMLRNAQGDPVAMLNIARDITDRRRLGRELERRNRQLLTLNTIATSISTSLNIDDVLHVACEQIRETIRADLVMLYLHDRARDRLVLARSESLTAENAERIATLTASASATGTVIREKQPLWIPEGLVDDPRVTGQGRALFSSLGIASLGVIPLQSKEEVLGALDVAFADRHEFPEEERQLLLLIGNQLGPAIENAQLYAEVQAQVQRITALYELGKRLTGSLDMQTLMEGVWQETAKVLSLDRFMYQTFSEARHSLAPAFVVEGETLRHGGGMGETLVEPDSPFWEVVTRGTSLRLDGSGEGRPGGSLLAVPIRSKERVLGVLSVQHASPRAYGDVHLRLLESIGNLTEIAVEKTRLYEDTIAKSAEIAERNKDLDDFTYVVSHDLKEPLISIEGYGRILLKDYHDRVDAEGKEYLNAVVQSTGRMKHLIDDLLTLSRLGRVSESVHMVSSQQVVEEILHELRFTILEKHVTVTVAPDLPDVRYDATQLSMVFRNLISNAIKFNDKPAPAITIACERRNDHLQFSVADNGIGIEPEYFEKVFMIFQRLQRSEEYRGTGAGLTIVKKIVEKHRGRIWIASVPGEGTTFFFTVPTGG